MRLGMRVKDAGLELSYMAAEDWIHVALPASPDMAVIFCNGSRCWESPFADAMYRAGIPYPEHSLLKGAPHKDIKMSDVPTQKRGRKTWPATTKWEVHIGKLSEKQTPNSHLLFSLPCSNFYCCEEEIAIGERKKRSAEICRGESF